MKQEYKEIAEQFGIDLDGDYVWNIMGGSDDADEFHGKGWEVCKEIHEAAEFCVKNNGMTYDKALDYAEKEVVAYVTEEEWEANQP